MNKYITRYYDKKEQRRYSQKYTSKNGASLRFFQSQ